MGFPNLRNNYKGVCWSDGGGSRCLHICLPLWRGGRGILHRPTNFDCAFSLATLNQPAIDFFWHICHQYMSSKDTKVSVTSRFIFRFRNSVFSDHRLIVVLPSICSSLASDVVIFPMPWNYWVIELCSLCSHLTEFNMVWAFGIPTNYVVVCVVICLISFRVFLNLCQWLASCRMYCNNLSLVSSG